MTKEQVAALSHSPRIGGASGDTEVVAGGSRMMILGHLLPCGSTNAFR